MESQLGVWWATRIGVAMAVIGAVFFGVYINMDASPLYRFLQLFLGTLTAIGLSLALEKKVPKIAPALLAGACAVLYFAAFGSYAVPAIRVFTQPLPSAVFQGIVVAFIVALSLWKNRLLMVNMAVFLGYLSSWFSLSHSMDSFSLTAALGWTAVAFWIRERRGWSAPGFWAMGGNLLLFFVSLGYWSQGGLAAPAVLEGWGFWGIVFALTLFAEIRLSDERRAATLHAGRLLMWGASAGALGLGYVFTRNLYPQYLAQFFFGFGLLLLIGSYLAQKREIDSGITLPLFLKGTLWLALGWMEIFDGEARWLALLGQTAIVAFMWPRRFSSWIEAAWTFFWLLSLGCFLQSHFSNAAPNPTWISSVLYGVGSFALFIWKEKTLKQSGLIELKRRLVLHGFIGCLLALMTVVAVVEQCDHHRMGYGFLLGFASVALISWRMKVAAYSAIISSSLIGAMAYLWIWEERGTAGELLELFPQAMLWVLMTLGSVALIWRRAKVNKWILFAERTLHCLWMLAWTIAFWRAFGHLTAYFSLLFLGLALIPLARRYPFHTLRQMLGIPWVLLWIIWVETTGSVEPWTDWMNLAAVWVAWIWVRPWRFAEVDPLNKDTPMWIRPGTLASLVGWWSFSVVHEQLDVPYQFLGLALAGVGFTLFWIKSRNVPGLVWSFILILTAVLEWHVMAGSRLGKTGVELDHKTLWLILGVGLGVLCCALSKAHTLGTLKLSRNGKRWLQWTWCLIGLGMVYRVLGAPGFELKQQLTLYWGVAAMALFGFGLISRNQPARLTALWGLGICILRLFIFDIQETLHRIFAFGALGVVLLAIGFLYNRFRKYLIEED